MTQFLNFAIQAFTGFCAGLVISGAIFAFIAAIGVIPRLAYRSGTMRYIKLYEESIVVGGIFGASTIAFDYSIPIGSAGSLITGLAYGVFVGCLAMCLAEVLNAIPILSRRTNLQKGLNLFIIALAAGKAAGALIYFFAEGFS